MPFEVLPEFDPLKTVIKVIGVGGGGGNAVEHMITHGAKSIEFIAANTDHQALQRSKAHVNIQLGSTGLGAGARPEIGAAAAQEKREQIADAIRGANLLFITAGMGGGTGTGAAPVIAEIARELGILTVAVVTKPFSFEGARRMRTAETGIENLKAKVDSMIVILNEKLEEQCPPNATMVECFETSNEVLYKACVGIAEIIHTPGTINVDFEDLKTVMSERGSAIIGLATASGPDRAKVAAEQAIACPLLEGANLQGARGMLVYFTGNDSLTLAEIREGMNVLNTFVEKQANVIFGSAISEEMGDEVRVTVVATGLDRPMDLDTGAAPDLGTQLAGGVAPTIGGTGYVPPTFGQAAAAATSGEAPRVPTIDGPAKTEAPKKEPAPTVTSSTGYTIPTYLRSGS
ncbi:cell division protein FtsZ [Sutterella sp.]|uniref:cell division protein FtsZ n=1 Tax=Sutterella sp. TaxID=1981025 RepID=UPI0026DED08E|nr:cell division protein FtsZ [Sutterella sp.]MDO5530830.1 cell division protein FtsZ [Sutterella sp.]